LWVAAATGGTHGPAVHHRHPVICRPGAHGATTVDARRRAAARRRQTPLQPVGIRRLPQLLRMKMRMLLRVRLLLTMKMGIMMLMLMRMLLMLMLMMLPVRVTAEIAATTVGIRAVTREWRRMVHRSTTTATIHPVPAAASAAAGRAPVRRAGTPAGATGSTTGAAIPVPAIVLGAHHVQPRAPRTVIVLVVGKELVGHPAALLVVLVGARHHGGVPVRVDVIAARFLALNLKGITAVVAARPPVDTLGTDLAGARVALAHMVNHNGLEPVPQMLQAVGVLVGDGRERRRNAAKELRAIGPFHPACTGTHRPIGAGDRSIFVIINI
jgi:hypothetical protein